MPIKLIIGLVFAGVWVGSLGLRAALGDGDSTPKTEASRPAEGAPTSNNPFGVGSSSLVPGGSSTTTNPQPTPPNDGEVKPADGKGIEDYLPVITEASFFGFLGFALGYASKKILKIAMIFIGLFFLALQGLVFLKIATLDWSRAVELTNTFITNIKQDQSFSKVLTDRIPAAATLVTGFLLGFRRG